MTISIPTRAEALAAYDRIVSRGYGSASGDLYEDADLSIIRRVLDSLPEPVATHRFWHPGLLEWEECACSAPAHEHEDWYPLQFH